MFFVKTFTPTNSVNVLPNISFTSDDDVLFVRLIGYRTEIKVDNLISSKQRMESKTQSNVEFKKEFQTNESTSVVTKWTEIKIKY